jgi:ABC-type lipoprotein release transport system permease subunit
LRFAGSDPQEVRRIIVQVLNRLLGVVLGILGAVLGVVLGIVAALIWLVGAVLCVTVLLIPLGIPVMKLGSRLFSLAGDMMHIGG